MPDDDDDVIIIHHHNAVIGTITPDDPLYAQILARKTQEPLSEQGEPDGE